MNMRMRVVYVRVRNRKLLLVCFEQKLIMPPKGGSERSELTPCNSCYYALPLQPFQLMSNYIKENKIVFFFYTFLISNV